MGDDIRRRTRLAKSDAPQNFLKTGFAFLRACDYR